MRARRGAVAIVVVGLGLGLTACTGGQSLDDFAPQFHQDANEVLDAFVDSYSADPDAVDVVKDGSEDVSCDDGARREFEATFPMMEGEPDSNLDLFTRAVVVGFEVDHDYEMVGEGDYYSGTERTYRATNEDETITFEVQATGEPNSEVTFTGETTCAST